VKNRAHQQLLCTRPQPFLCPAGMPRLPI